MRVWQRLMIALLFLAACTAVPDPTPTPVQNVAEVATLVVERPSATPPPTLTATPQPTVTLEPTATEEMATETAVPTSTPMPFVSPIWNPEIELLYLIDSDNIVWSPLRNEFLYGTCSAMGVFDRATDGKVFLVSISGEQSTIAQDFICSAFGIKISWTPDGQQVLFTGSPLDISAPIESEGIFITDITDRDKQVLLTGEQVGTKWGPDFRFWLDEHTFLYSGYITGGRELNALVNIQTNTRSLSLRISHAEDISAFYLVGDNGMQTTSYTSAFAIPLEEMWSTSLGFDFFDRYALSPSIFSSAFMDWLPDTNQMLVLTWDKDLDLYEDAPVTTQLQMWDMAANTLTMLIPRGTDGRFSPDGAYLAYLTRNENGFDIQLLNRADNRVIFTTPQYSKENDELGAPSFSFSPDGRFFTFYVHDAVSPDDSLLKVFDIPSQQVIAELPATPYWEFTWSPNSEYFLYENEYGRLALFNLKDSSTISLTENNDSRLSKPQWSFDGSYLSVTVGEKTAVLSIP